MRKPILLLGNNNYLDIQVLRPVNYSTIIKEFDKQAGGNSGNKLFMTAVEKYLQNTGGVCTF